MWTDTDLVLTVAASLDFVREEPRNTNDGQAVRAMLKVTGLTQPAPWCAAYVAYCGVRALGTRWPLPHVAGCMSLYDFARAKGWIVETPQRGDIFLIWFPKMNRFAHTGFVVSTSGMQATCYEGNTNDGGSRDGWGVFKRQRTFKSQDRFIRLPLTP